MFLLYDGREEGSKITHIDIILHIQIHNETIQSTYGGTKMKYKQLKFTSKMIAFQINIYYFNG
jgi:hypothetical protein